MVMQALPSKTSREHGQRLAWVLETGTLRDVVDELASPTWPSTPPAPHAPTHEALSVLDSSSGHGDILLATAATAPSRTDAHRLACWSLLLDKGANPFARGNNGRSIESILRYKGDDVARYCLEDLEYARDQARKGERYQTPEDIIERIRVELDILDGKMVLEQNNVLKNGPSDPARPAAKRPRPTSPLPDYEDEQPAKRAPEHSSIAAFQAALQQQQQQKEAKAAAAAAAVAVPAAPPPIRMAPTPAPQTSLPNRRSTLVGLSSHDSWVFMPLVQTLRAMYKDDMPQPYHSQAACELRARFPNVYSRDPNYPRWKPYVLRAEELGVVTICEGKKQNAETVRLNLRYLREPRQQPVQPTHRPPTAVPPARPDTAARVQTGLRRPPPPPPPPPYIPRPPASPRLPPQQQTNTSALPSRALSVPAAAAEPSRGNLPVDTQRAAATGSQPERPISAGAPASRLALRTPPAPAEARSAAPAATTSRQATPPHVAQQAQQDKPKSASLSRLPPSVKNSALSVSSSPAPSATTGPSASPSDSGGKAPPVQPFALPTAPVNISLSSASKEGMLKSRLPPALAPSTPMTLVAQQLPATRSPVPHSAPAQRAAVVPPPAPAIAAVSTDQPYGALAAAQPAPPSAQAATAPFRPAPTALQQPYSSSPAPPYWLKPSYSPAPSTSRVPYGPPAPTGSALAKERKTRLPINLLTRLKTATPAPPVPAVASGPGQVAAGGPTTGSSTPPAGPPGPALAPTPAAVPPPTPARTPAPPSATSTPARPVSRLPHRAHPPPTALPPVFRVLEHGQPVHRRSPLDATWIPRRRPLRLRSTRILTASVPTLAPIPAASARPRAAFVTMELRGLPAYATAPVVRRWLLGGPRTFAHVAPADLARLNDVVEARTVAPPSPRPEDAPVPPIVHRVELHPDRAGCARVLYTSRAQALAARAIFDGRRIVDSRAGEGERGVVWVELEGEVHEHPARSSVL